jgi:hypothetical protein
LQIAHTPSCTFNITAYCAGVSPNFLSLRALPETAAFPGFASRHRRDFVAWRVEKVGSLTFFAAYRARQ